MLNTVCNGFSYFYPIAIHSQNFHDHDKLKALSWKLFSHSITGKITTIFGHIKT